MDEVLEALRRLGHGLRALGLSDTGDDGFPALGDLELVVVNLEAPLVRRVVRVHLADDPGCDIDAVLLLRPLVVDPALVFKEVNSVALSVPLWNNSSIAIFSHGEMWFWPESFLLLPMSAFSWFAERGST